MEPGRRVTDPVRATRRRAFVVVMGLATSAMVLVRGIIAQGDIVSGEGLVLLLSLLALVIVAAIVRTFMLGVSLGPKGVMIRSFVMSQRIRWPDIVEVGVIGERTKPRDDSPVEHFPTITYLNEFRFKKHVILWSLGAAEPALAQERADAIRELVATHGGPSGEPAAEAS